MKLDEFIDIIVKEHHLVRIGSYEEPPILHVDNIIRAKKLTEKINYKCGFDDVGWCFHQQGDPRDSMNEMCCCRTCRPQIGYLRHIWDIAHLPVLAEHFCNETGFWQEGGCALPRELRSEMCLTYCCGHDDLQRMEKLLIGLIETFNDEVNGRLEKIDVILKALIEFKVLEGVIDSNINDKVNLCLDAFEEELGK